MKLMKINDCFFQPVILTLFVLVLIILPCMLFAQPKPLHVSLIHTVSTDGKESKEMDYHFSFNLFSGIVRDIKGLEMGTFYNENTGNLKGVQISGLLNKTAGTATGLQVAGLTNLSGNIKGIQAGGITNHSRSVHGIQVAGLINTSNEIIGIQLGGILNRATILNGIQIGLVNIADDGDNGIGIGLLNIYKKGGYRELEFSANDYLNSGITLRTGTKKLYSILSVGYHFRSSDYIAGGFGAGTLLSIGTSFYIKPEFLMYHYVTTDLRFKNTINSYHFRSGLMYKIDNIGISVYPGLFYHPARENATAHLGWFDPIRIGTKGSWNIGLGLGLNFIL